MKKIIFVFFIIYSNSYAHELWFTDENNSQILHYGHFTDGHQGTQSIDYPAHYLKQTICLDQNQQTLSPVISQQTPIQIKAECALTYALLSSGFWTKTLEGSMNLPKNQINNPLKSWQSFESIKRIKLWHSDFIKPITQTLELLPLQNPLLLTLDEKVSLKLVNNGQPVKNAIVLYMGQPRGQTDEQGKINIRLKEKGLQLVQATYRQPSDKIQADELVHTTHLLFEISGEKS
jgi:nickel transport protein